MASEALTEQLDNALDNVNATTTFAVGGRADSLPLPSLNVTDVGLIALPLQPSQALALRAVSVQSPFGRGSETVIDTSVRSCREIPTQSISLGQAWNSAIQNLATNMASSLGVTTKNVSAELYKLVLYQPGDFFKPHKDTEKSPGMFATLVVQLPSAFSSAALIVSHRNQRKVFNYAEGSAEHFFTTAFFTDCEHELAKVTGGNRLVLLYNLIRCDGRTPCRELVRHDAVLDKLAKVADDWQRDGLPEKLTYMLEHKYTEKNISFQKLKGNDAVRVSVLRQSAKFDIFLALVEKHDYGSAEPRDYYSFRRGYCGDDDEDGTAYTMQDVIESSVTLNKVIDEDDVEVSMPVLDFDDEEQENLFEGLDPDREAFEGYTGNAGPTLEYFYHCAVLLILPRWETFSYACESSFQEGVRVIRRHLNSSEADAEETLLEAVDYAEQSPSETYNHLPDLLDIACKIKHKNAARALIALMDTGSNISHGGCSSEKHVEALANAANLFELEEFEPLVTSLVKKTPAATVAHAAALAVRFAKVDNMHAFADCVAKIVMSTCESGPVNEKAVGNVAEMLFKLSSCASFRASFLERCLQMPPASLAACIVSVLKCYTGKDVEGEIPAEIPKLVRRYVSVAFRASAAREAASHAGSVFGALLCVDPRDEQLLNEISRKIVNTGCAHLLRETLRAPAVWENGSNAHVVLAASARAKQLRYPKPVATNVQPDAFVPRHPKVTAFFRSNAPSMKYQAFVDYKHASNFARKHFWGKFNQREKHCANVTVHGNSEPYAIITKVNHVQEKKMKQYERDQTELQELQRFLGTSGVETVNDSVKRRRINSIEVIEID